MLPRPLHPLGYPVGDDEPLVAVLPCPTILGRKKLEPMSAPPVPMLMYRAQKKLLVLDSEDPIGYVVGR